MMNQTTAASSMQRYMQIILLVLTTALLSNSITAFQPIHTTHNRSTRHTTTPTTLYLEDDIAKMIDNEMRRLYQNHIESNNDPTTSTTSVPGFTTGVDRSISSPLRRKDEKLAHDDPMRYCADRCVSTGNCDVFEDMFGLGPEEVMKFCKECVLSVEEEPCDVPVSWWEDDDDDWVLEDGGLHP